MQVLLLDINYMYSGKKVLPWSATAELLRLSACAGRSRLPARVKKGDRLYAVSLSFSFLNIYKIYTYTSRTIVNSLTSDCATSL
jgi:hypothetical protein